jgi:hypothetical protein
MVFFKKIYKNKDLINKSINDKKELEKTISDTENTRLKVYKFFKYLTDN